MTETNEDATLHAGVVTLSTPSILREFDLSENESVVSKLDAASSAPSTARLLTVLFRFSAPSTARLLTVLFRLSPDSTGPTNDERGKYCQLVGVLCCLTYCHWTFANVGSRS